MRHRFLIPLILAAAVAAPAAELPEPTYGPELQGFAYPFPLKHFALASQGESLQMAYMDVPPQGRPNGRTAVLMHGKNFCGATWEHQIASLSDAGYRVIVPDLVGFGESSHRSDVDYHYAAQAQRLHLREGLA